MSGKTKGSERGPGSGAIGREGAGQVVGGHPGQAASGESRVPGDFGDSERRVEASAYTRRGQELLA